MTYSTDVLDISATASHDEIRSAYRKQARSYHPDSFDPDQLDATVPNDLNANELFIDIQKARDALINGERNVSFNHDWENGEPVFTQSHDEQEENETGTGDQQEDNSSEEERDVHGGSNETGGNNTENTGSSSNQHGTSDEDTEVEDETDDDDGPWESNPKDDGDIGDTVGVDIDDEEEQTVSADEVEQTVSVNDNSEGGVITTRRAILTAGLGIGLYTLGGQIPSFGGNGGSSGTQLSDHVVVDPSETINEAAERVAAGGVLEIPSGNYEQNLVTEKEMSIVAPDGATLVGDGADAAGIYVANADVEIEGLTIVDFGDSGIVADAAGHEVTIQNVTIDDVGKSGIEVSGEEVILEDIEVSNTRDHGVELYSTIDGSVDITGISAIDCGSGGIGRDDYNGIMIDGAGEISVQDGEILDSEQENILVKSISTPDDQNIELNDLFSADSGGRGIRIEGGRGDDTITINSVEVQDSGGRGVTIGDDNAVDSVQIEDLNVHDHSNYAVDVTVSRTGDFEITESEITDVSRSIGQRGGHGVRIRGSENIDFDDVRITDTNDEAIRIDPENVEGQRIVLQDVVTSEESLSDDLDIDESRGGNNVIIN